jgi:hypothetical protein
MAKKKKDLEETHIYEASFEFQCDKCDEFTNLGGTRPKDGAVVTCKHCGAKYLASNE